LPHPDHASISVRTAAPTVHFVEHVGIKLSTTEDTEDAEEKSGLEQV
jgi:hypothetical protein